MDTASHVVALLIIGYLLGSIPFAKLFTMRAGIDLFETGTGNPGAANVFRKVDKRIGAAVFLADGLKGSAPVLIAWAIGTEDSLWVIGGLAAIIGHWYPVFNKFKGGAGLASSAGVVVALMPLAGLIGLFLGMLVIWKVKSSGHGALTGLITMLLAAYFIPGDWPIGVEWPAMAAAIGIAIVIFGRSAARGWKPGRKD